MLNVACKNNQEKLLDKINAIELEDKLGTPEGLAELAELHSEYGLKYHNEQANNFLYSAAHYYFYEGKKDRAKNLLFEYISRDDSTDRFRNSAINLSKLLSDEEKRNHADELISETIESQLPTSAQWQDIIAIYTAKIESKTDVRPTDYERLALAHTATGNFTAAISNLDSAILMFKDYEKRVDLMFRAGSIGWEYIDNKEIAKSYYNQIIKEYPNSPLVSDAHEILSKGMLYKTNEEILEMIKGQNK